MKKVLLSLIGITLLLCVLFSLTACGDKETPAQTTSPETETESETDSDSKTEESTKPSTNMDEAEVGTVLSSPEKTFDTDDVDDMYLRFLYTANGEETHEFEIAVDTVTDDTYVLYVTDGMMKTFEAVYEVSDDSIQKYGKIALIENFVLDTETSQADLQADVTYYIGLMTFFTSDYFANFDESVEYHKKNDFKSPYVGDVWVYDIYEGGEKSAEIRVDKDTGLISNLELTDGSSKVTLEEYSFDYDIPEYK